MAVNQTVAVCLTIIRECLITSKAFKIVTDANVRAWVIDVQAKMESFDYFFGVNGGELVLNHGDNLSAALLSSRIFAAEGQHIVSLTVSTIAKICTDQCFSLFWDSVQKKAAEVKCHRAKHSLVSKAARRFETGNAAAHYSSHNTSTLLTNLL